MSGTLHRRRGLSAILALSMAVAPAAPAALAGELISPLTPTFRNLPITATSKPIRDPGEDLAKAGYVEEEYIMSGQARVFDWAADGGVKVMVPPSPYATRVLVHRPRDPARWSGNIEVHINNSSARHDHPRGISAYALKNGDVWVGFTSKGITARDLQKKDPARYGDLNWKNPLPLDKTCKDPTIGPMWTRTGDYSNKDSSSFPETEDGLIYDIYGQLAAFLKGPGREKLLPGFKETPKLFTTGVSQSALLMRTWINAFHSNYRMPDGGPIFDGYQEIVGSLMYRINQCAVDFLPWDPRNQIAVPTDAAVINMFSESDMWKGLYSRQPDVIKGRSGLVTYEMAGSAHGGVLYPRTGIEAAALHNLQKWVREGVAPPRGQPIKTVYTQMQRDWHGNVIGGLRTPYLDVPVATYQGTIAPQASAPGKKTPFAPEKLKLLYPSRDAYLAKFDAEVDRMVRERWLLPEGAEQMKADARKAPIPE